MPRIEKRAFREITDLLKQLKTRKGQVVKSMANLRLINTLSRQIDRAILNAGYRDATNQYLKSFNEVTKTQNLYFRTVFDAFKMPSDVSFLKEQAIQDTTNLMLRSGYEAALTNPIKEILNTNISAQADFFDLNKTIKDFLTGTDETVGALQKHSGTITTDAINTYSAQVNQSITEDLGLEWYRYVGSIVNDSRPFCVALVKKKWFHKDEIPGFLDGKVGKVRVKKNPRTGLPEGMRKGTTPENFQILRGGYRCNHQVIPVATESVPKSVRDAR